MSWERFGDRLEKAICACGKGFVTRNVYTYGDDWGRYETGIEHEEIECNKCSSKYHIEHLTSFNAYERFRKRSDGVVDTTYLVPNGHTLKIQTEPKGLPFEYSVNFEKKVVALFKKEDLIAVVEDMKKSKYSTRLSLGTSEIIVSMHLKAKNSCKLSNVIASIEPCINNYDSYEWTFDKIQTFRQEEAIILQKNQKKLQQTLSASIELNFEDAR